MENLFEIIAESRTDIGKGASRRLRHAGRVPGIIYGGKDEPSMITLDHDSFMHQLENESFYSHLLTLKVDDQPISVVLRDLQRHPAKPFILHADFQRVDESAPINLQVPLHFINEESCVGVKAGGRIRHVLASVELRCLPKDLPEYVEVDMQAFDMGQNVHVSDITLPENVSLASQHDIKHNPAVASVGK